MKFIKFRNAEGQYYWRLVSGNSEILCSSEGYHNSADRDRSLSLVMGVSQSTPVVETEAPADEEG